MQLNECNIALVGSGNVASHLAKALSDRLVAIFSRNAEHASELSAPLGVGSFSDYAELGRLKPDVIIISIADHAVSEVVASIGRLDYSPLVLHTSGTLTKEILCPISDRVGILYPLQTFSKGCAVDMTMVPFFTEASSPEDLEIVDALASSVSATVRHADEAHRRVLHVAGVFTSNFTNILLDCVERILSEAGYEMEVVEPLLKATVAKAFEVGPRAAQTGPARRGDYEVLARQEASLPEDLRPVYKVLSDLIIKTYHKGRNESH